jgi:hypothetical protein
MFQIIKSLFTKPTKRLPGAEMSPMTDAEAAAYWNRMRLQSEQTGGW